MNIRVVLIARVVLISSWFNNDGSLTCTSFTCTFMNRAANLEQNIQTETKIDMVHYNQRQNTNIQNYILLLLVSIFDLIMKI